MRNTNSSVYIFLYSHGLVTQEDVEQVMGQYGNKRRIGEKCLLVKCFAKYCLKEEPEAITPKKDVLQAFQAWCRSIGLYGQTMKNAPLIQMTGLTNLLCQIGPFTETRTHRNDRQRRAFKGLALK